MTMAGALGLVIGLTLALTGAGGGILAVPALVFGLGLTMAEAGPIALFAVAMAAAFGATLGLRAGVVRYRAAGVMAAAGMALSPLGIRTAHQLPNAPLAGIFGLFLAWVAVQVLRRARVEAASAGAASVRLPTAPRPLCARDPVRGRFIWTGPCASALAGCGLLAGFLSGLLGVGGGFIIVPLLARISDLPMRSITATSLAVITFVSASGVVFAALDGQIQWHVALPFAVGAVAGMVAGRRIADHIAGHRLQQMFAAVAGVVAIAMLYKSAIWAAGLN